MKINKTNWDQGSNPQNLGNEPDYWGTIRWVLFIFIFLFIFLFFVEKQIKQSDPHYSKSKVNGTEDNKDIVESESRIIDKGQERKETINHEEIVEDYTNEMNASYEKEDAYYRQKKAEAVKNYTEAIQYYLKVVDLGLKEKSEAMKKYTEAIQHYTKVIELDPERADAYYSRGAVNSAIKNYEEAIEDYTKTTELDPEYEAAYFDRGRVKSTIKDYLGAIEDYTKVIALNPKHADAYFFRGVVKSVLGDYHKALQDLNKARELGKTEAYKVIQKINEVIS
ncbi:MAG: tetratricopeptide repeat protein [Candidatus Omnitrophica bacterium]|jgi:tetratricopeptide (TPR) repeat protein|nr:tetratricopeptide repeat protein [Candidatus Omnitrophota bacterium]